MLYEFKITSNTITMKKYKILQRLPRTIEYELVTQDGTVVPSRILKCSLNIVKYGKLYTLDESEGKDYLIDDLRNRITISKRYIRIVEELLKQVKEGGFK
jgi:hypothetical protein